MQSTTIPYRHWTPKMHGRGHHLDIFGLHNYIECSHLKLWTVDSYVGTGPQAFAVSKKCSKIVVVLVWKYIVRNQQRLGKARHHCTSISNIPHGYDQPPGRPFVWCHPSQPWLRWNYTKNAHILASAIPFKFYTGITCARKGGNSQKTWKTGKHFKCFIDS